MADLEVHLSITKSAPEILNLKKVIFQQELIDTTHKTRGRSFRVKVPKIHSPGGQTCSPN